MNDQEKPVWNSSNLSPKAGESSEGADELPVSTSVQSEDRRAARQRMFKKAEIEIAGNFGNVPCIVRNTSTTGALVELEGNYVVPEQFVLIVPMDGTRVECQLVRQHLSKIGLRYTGQIKVFRAPEKQAIQASSDDYFKNFTRTDNYYTDLPSETELAIRRHGNKPGVKKSGFGNR